MLRPIPPRMAWQVIAAFAGFFTLAAALATPVDLWRLTVHSHQGEPFRATATLASRPDERISTACLSMGPESDAPDSGLPFLRQADLEFNSARGTVDISTRGTVSAPAVALVLRVQCAGAPLYARHFTALIPPGAKPAAAQPASGKTTTPQSGTTQSIPPPSIPAASMQAKTATPDSAPPAQMKPDAAQAAQTQQRAQAKPAKQPGFHLSLLPGDSVASIAAVLFPGKPQVQQRLTQQVIAGNPRIFPDGRARDVPAGTVLWFPDVHELRKSSIEKPESPVAGTLTTPSTAPAASASGETPPAQAPSKPRSRITLRRALALGDRPGAQECKQLMQLCRAEPMAAATSPALEEKTRTLESGVQQLRLKQDSIDQQMARIEQSIQALQRTIASAPAQPVPIPSPAQPRVEIRTVVKSEPISWYIWLGLAGLVVMAALAGVAYGRRGTLARETVGTDEQLDRMLATAATAMRELEAAPKPAPRPRAPPPPRPPVQRAPPPPPENEPPAAAEESEPAGASATPDLLLEADSAQNMTELDVHLESAPPEPPQVDGLSSEVLYEMDQALDNTRSMFTDVDRFIALGRTRNALSLLQFQVHKDPKDRDSWIKLLAIYRQEKMDDELTKAAREFKRNFPAENLPG